MTRNREFWFYFSRVRSCRDIVHPCSRFGMAKIAKQNDMKTRFEAYFYIFPEILHATFVFLVLGISTGVDGHFSSPVMLVQWLFSQVTHFGNILFSDFLAFPSVVHIETRHSCYRPEKN